MKLILKLLLGLVVIVIIAIGAVLFLIPANSLKPLLVQGISSELGREVAIDGDLNWQFWPPVTIKADGLRLANLPGFEPANMIRAAEVEIAVDLLANFNGVAKLDRLRLIDPEIYLQRGSDGQANWDLYPSDASAPAREEPLQPSDRPDLPRLSVGSIAIENGLFRYFDDQANVSHVIDEIALSLMETEGALVIDGGALYNNEAISIDGRVDDLNAAVAGASVPVQLGVRSGLFDLAVAGLVGSGEADAITLDLTVDRVTALADWLDSALVLPAETPEIIALRSTFSVMPEQVNVTEFSVVATPWQISGQADLALGDQPKLSGFLDLGTIDLTPWMVNTSEQPPSEEAAPPTAASGWPDEPIELPLPLPLSIDLSLIFTSIKVDQLEIGPGTVAIYADNLTARVELSELSLYAGDMSLGVAVGDFGDVPSITARIDAANVQALPTLQAVADFDRLEGLANIDADLSTSGSSIKAMIENLQGQGGVSFRDGAILGINLASTLRQIASLGLSGEAEGPRQTDFAELSGTFAIQSGIVTNEDLQLRAPILRLEGAGTVDLPVQSLDYAVTPRLSATLEGQNAVDDDVAGAGIPLVISGAWSDPQIQLAIGGTLSGDLRAPSTAGQLAAQLGSNPEQLLQLREQFGLGGELELPVPTEEINEAIEGVEEQLDQLNEGLGGLLNR